MIYLEHCMDPLDASYQPPLPRPGTQTLGIYKSEWLACRALSELLSGSCSEGYHVCPTERGFEVIREQQP